MPFVLKDRLFASVLFNGTEFPFEINALDFIHISASVRTILPALTLKLKDTRKFLTLNNFLVDGTKITVTVGKDNSQKTTYNFRLFSFSQAPSNNPEYTIRGYLDTPLYWTSSLSTFQKGSSSSVLAALAQRCGMSFDGITTSDSQVWIPQNKRIADFAHEVMLHGWANNSSCMKMGITAKKQMRYRNVSAFATMPVLDFFDKTKISQQVKPMTDHKVMTKSGFFNVKSGYNDRRISQSVDANDQEVASLSFEKNSSKLMLNTELRGQIQRNQVLYSPIDVGNVHANYERAVYQNRRMSNLFTLGLELMTPVFCDSDLLDVVSVAVDTPDVLGSKQYSGKYMVTSKVVYVQGANYFEKLELARHGLNESRETTQD